MPRMIYEYTKDNLEKLSFDPIKFKRELNKASKTLKADEIETLSKWLNYYTKNRVNLYLIVLNFYKKDIN